MKIGLAITLAVLLLTGCSTGPSTGSLAEGSAATSGVAAAATSGAQSADLSDYRLGPSDRVRLIVFQEEDLSGTFAISADGKISLPLVGPVTAADKTIEEFRADLEALLSDGYLQDARVAVEVAEYRPFYILGEVERAGEYPFLPGMDAVKAIASAGGFTYRAKRSTLYIQRAGASEEVKLPATSETKILPGDVVRVAERFF